MIGPIGATGYTTYAYPIAGSHMAGGATAAVSGINGVNPVGEKNTINVDRAEKTECQTCKERKYMDVSNDSNVSFQTPTHVSPQASFAAVASHEQEHVSNAVAEGNRPGKQLISSSVSYEMGICPECGKSYVAGGTTRTQIRYTESNPYERSRKSAEASFLRGMYFDSVA